MTHFDFDGEFVTPKVANYYHIPVEQLHFYTEEGTHHWFPHLARKSWFTEDMFWELLKIAKKYHTETNFDKAIFQASQVFKMRDVYENIEQLYSLHKKSEE